MRTNNLLSALLLLFVISAQAQNPSFTLADFYEQNALLDFKTDSTFYALTEQEKVAQMIIGSAGELGKPDAKVEQLIKDKMIGGVILMKDSKMEHKMRVAKFQELARQTETLPLLFSADAEPSLLNSRIKGSQKVGKTINIQTTAQCDSIVKIINSELREIGIHQNYAPVLDIGPDNAAIQSRSFGRDKHKVIELCQQFSQSSKEGGILATVKHFPGHGLVKGDTHKQSVYIDGDLQELDNYRPLIDDGALSIMVAHIVVKNNLQYQSDGLPATLSRTIVTDLLKNELGFKGLVITDALNIMKAVTIYEDAPLMASKAGCDLLLMPIDEGKVMKSILAEMEKDELYKEQVYQSVRKIIRMKVCLGLIK